MSVSKRWNKLTTAQQEEMGRRRNLRAERKTNQKNQFALQLVKRQTLHPTQLPPQMVSQVISGITHAEALHKIAQQHNYEWFKTQGYTQAPKLSGYPSYGEGFLKKHPTGPISQEWINTHQDAVNTNLTLRNHPIFETVQIHSFRDEKNISVTLMPHHIFRKGPDVQIGSLEHLQKTFAQKGIICKERILGPHEKEIAFFKGETPVGDIRYNGLFSFLGGGFQLSLNPRYAEELLKIMLLESTMAKK